MVYSEIFATSAEVLQKAGFGASATSSAAAYITSFMYQAESYINVLCHYNFSDNYSTLNDDVRGILKEAASNLAAIYVIQYDTRGYPSTRDAENIINICWARFENCVHLLNDEAAADFLKKA